MNPFEITQLIIIIIIISLIIYGIYWLYKRYKLCGISPLCYITNNPNIIDETLDKLSEDLNAGPIFKAIENYNK